jgi:hypothetical protein
MEGDLSQEAVVIVNPGNRLQRCGRPRPNIFADQSLVDGDRRLERIGKQ